MRLNVDKNGFVSLVSTNSNQRLSLSRPEPIAFFWEPLETESAPLNVKALRSKEVDNLGDERESFVDSVRNEIYAVRKWFSQARISSENENRSKLTGLVIAAALGLFLLAVITSPKIDHAQGNGATDKNAQETEQMTCIVSADQELNDSNTATTEIVKDNGQIAYPLPDTTSPRRTVPASSNSRVDDNCYLPGMN